MFSWDLVYGIFFGLLSYKNLLIAANRRVKRDTRQPRALSMMVA